jgi:hypothetical protein
VIGCTRVPLPAARIIAFIIFFILLVKHPLLSYSNRSSSIEKVTLGSFLSVNFAES